MSRKNFIITALLINFTICVTLCIVLFTEKDDNLQEENTRDNMSVQESEADVDSGQYTGNWSNRESTSDKEDTEDKIVESQVSKDTQPATYNTSEQESSTGIQETTTLGIYAGATKAFVNSSCNVRAGADVRSEVIGILNAGGEYRIEPSLCTESWIAVYINDTTVGYIGSSFCSVS